MHHGETHGILIGPHSSNILSEIILTVVDRKLYEKHYRYVRAIDDYIAMLKVTRMHNVLLLILRKHYMNLTYTSIIRKQK